VGFLGIKILKQAVAESQESRRGFKMDVRQLLPIKRKKAVAVDRVPAMILRGLRMKMSCKGAESVVRTKAVAKTRSIRRRRVEAQGVRSNLQRFRQLNLFSINREKAVAVDRGPAMVLRGLRVQMSGHRAEPVLRAKTAKARNLRRRRVEAKGVRSNLEQRVFRKSAGLLSPGPLSRLVQRLRQLRRLRRVLSFQQGLVQAKTKPLS
jgi:hypothetical protein